MTPLSMSQTQLELLLPLVEAQVVVKAVAIREERVDKVARKEEDHHQESEQKTSSSSSRGSSTQYYRTKSSKITHSTSHSRSRWQPN